RDRQGRRLPREHGVVAPASRARGARGDGQAEEAVKNGRWLEGDGDPAAIELRRALDDARLATPDDVTLRRMWGRVSQPGPRRLRAPRWLWFVSGMACTAALAFALRGWLSPRTTPLPPAAAVATAPAPLPAPGSGPELVAPGTVRTGAGETLRLTLRGGAEVDLGSSTVMSVDQDERPRVEGGEVGFRVPHQASGQSFVVHAGPYRVLVVGTTFGLRVDERRRVFVSVSEGTVEIWGGRTRLARLQPGERWES